MAPVSSLIPKNPWPESARSVDSVDEDRAPSVKMPRMADTPTPMPIWLMRTACESYVALPEATCWLIRSPNRMFERL